jgi:hypothetical protein
MWVGEFELHWNYAPGSRKMRVSLDVESNTLQVGNLSFSSVKLDCVYTLIQGRLVKWQ